MDGGVAHIFIKEACCKSICIGIQVVFGWNPQPILKRTQESKGSSRNEDLILP